MSYRRIRNLMVAGTISALSLVAIGLGSPAHAAPAGSVNAVPTSAARSVHVTLRNFTNQELHRASAKLTGGIWSLNQLPPETIVGFGQGSWQSESNGFATGTEGSVRYNSAIGPVTVTWDNPFVGSNSYSCTAPAGHSCGWNGGGGNNAGVTFFVI